MPTRPPANRADAEKLIPPDSDGSSTIRYLKKAQRVAALLSNLRTTNYTYSLDMHPFVYFYSREGNHQPTMFLAAAYWLRDLDKNGTIPELARNGLRGRLRILLREQFPYSSDFPKGKGGGKGCSASEAILRLPLRSYFQDYRE